MSALTPFLRNVAKLLSGAVVGQGLVILSMPILTRLYDPHAFALLQVFASTMGIVLVVSCLRYDQALMMAAQEDLAPLISTLLAILLPASLICGIVLYFFGERIFGSFGVSPSYLAVIGVVGPIVTALPNAAGFVLIRESHFSQVSVSRVVQSVAFIASAVGLYFLVRENWSLNLADILSRCCVSVLLSILVIRSTPNLRPVLSREAYARILKSYRNFPVLSLPGGILNAVGAYSNTIWMLALFSAGAAGAYALVERLLSAPIAMIAGAMAQVYQAELSPTSVAMKQPLAPGFRRLLRLQVQLGALPAIALLFLPPYVFPVVFGAQWGEAATFCQIMALCQFVQFVVGPFNMVPTLLRRLGLQFTWEISRFVLVTGSWVIAAWLKWPPLVALAAVMVATSAAYLFFLSLAYVAVLHRDEGLLATTGPVAV